MDGKTHRLRAVYIFECPKCHYTLCSTEAGEYNCATPRCEACKVDQVRTI